MKHLQKSLLCFVFFVTLLLYGTTKTNAQKPEKIAQDVTASTVLLKMKKTSGPGSLGSGFIIGTGLIATNYHVIKNTTKGTVKLVNGQNHFEIEGYTAIDEKRDLAILKVASLSAPVLPLGNSETVQVGQTVYVAGNPLD